MSAWTARPRVACIDGRTESPVRLTDGLGEWVTVKVHNNWSISQRVTELEQWVHGQRGHVWFGPALPAFLHVFFVLHPSVNNKTRCLTLLWYQNFNILMQIRNRHEYIRIHSNRSICENRHPRNSETLERYYHCIWIVSEGTSRRLVDFCFPSDHIVFRFCPSFFLTVINADPTVVEIIYLTVIVTDLAHSRHSTWTL